MIVTLRSRRMSALSGLTRPWRAAVVLAWGLCPLAIAGLAYGYWRAGLDLDESAVRQQLYVLRAIAVLAALYVIARSVTAIAMCLGARRA